jgi:hypothetical protein
VAGATIYMPTSVQSKYVHLLVCDEHFDGERLGIPAEKQRLQALLDQARHKYGHALCTCRPNSLKLQIRLRDGKYHLAVWPEQGQLHDSACIFYREDESEPQTKAVSKAHEKDDGTREIKLKFALDRSVLFSTPRPQSPTRLSAGDHNPPEQASLRELLNLMWKEASLTRWHPRWSRDWGRARHELIQAAQSITVKGMPLSERLFVPRPFRVSLKDEINREWDRFTHNLAVSQSDVIKSALIIAPVKKFSERTSTTDGRVTVSMHLRHMLSPIGISDTIHAFLGSNCKTALRRVHLNAQEDQDRLERPRPNNWIELSQPEVIAIAHVEQNSKGGIWARGVWLMCVHPQVFIPATNTDEILLIDALIQNGHQFSRLLSSQQATHRTQPEWTLRHVYDPNGKPVACAALEILSNGAGADFLAQRHSMAQGLSARGVPMWTWTPLGRQLGRVVPPLPPCETTPKNVALHTLNSITNAPGTRYCYV